MTVEVGYDEAALTEKIQSLKAVTKEQTQPTSAYPKYDGNSLVIQPETYGTAVDAGSADGKGKTVYYGI